MKKTTSKTNKKSKEEKKVLAILVPKIIVSMNLTKEYCSNPKKTMKKLYKKLEKIDFGELAVVTGTYPSYLNFAKNISKVKEVGDELEISILIGITALEHAINEELFEELQIQKKFNKKLINETILRKLSIEDKVSWFSLILKGKNFSDSKYWKGIKPYIKLRDELIVHYKPMSFNKTDKIQAFIKKNKVLELIEKIKKFISVFKKYRSKELKNHYLEIKKATKRAQEVYLK